MTSITVVPKSDNLSGLENRVAREAGVGPIGLKVCFGSYVKGRGPAICSIQFFGRFFRYGENENVLM